MKYTQLGRTGLKVSRLVLGTMNFGPQTDEADSHAIMDAALDAGINFFDTANVYGWGENKGRTEEIVGTWFAKGGGRRDKTVLATKVYGNMAPTATRSGPTTTSSPRSTSAGRWTPASSGCGTDYIDLYQFHHVDRDTPWDEIWQAIDVLVQQGKILYVGLVQLRRLAHRPGQRDGRPRAVRTAWSASSACTTSPSGAPRWRSSRPRRTYGLGVIPWSPLHGGLLGGALRKEREGGAARSASGRSADALADSAIRAPDPGVRGPARQARPGARRGRPGLAAHPPGRHRPDRRPAHRGPARLRAAGRRAGAVATSCWPRWTRSSPARARARRPSPGERTGRRRPAPAGRGAPGGPGRHDRDGPSRAWPVVASI